MSPPGNLLRHDAELLHHLPSDAGDAELQALQVVEGLELLAEPAAHLGAGVPARQAVEVLPSVELVEEIEPAAVIGPGGHLTRVQAEGDGGAERVGRILADVVIRRRMGHLDGAVGDRIGRLRRSDDLARREGLDLETAVGRLRHVAHEQLGRPEERVEGFREARRQPPLHLRHGLGDCGAGNRAGGETGSCRGEELTTLHRTLLGGSRLRQL